MRILRGMYSIYNKFRYFETICNHIANKLKYTVNVHVDCEKSFPPPPFFLLNYFIFVELKKISRYLFGRVWIPMNFSLTADDENVFIRFHAIRSQSKDFLTFLPVAIFVLSSPTYRKDLIREAVYTGRSPARLTRTLKSSWAFSRRYTSFEHSFHGDRSR